MCFNHEDGCCGGPDAPCYADPPKDDALERVVQFWENKKEE